MGLEELQDFIGKTIVVDTATSFLYIGTLDAVSDHFLSMTEVDVHDCNETQTTKEVYILEARKYGIRKNRKSVKVRQAQIISYSLLDDIILY
ncbi:MAG: hypothetical protein ACYTHN_08130 [Planctomycetota bacterium]|jgi:small nuclear ribonucleoprotein (snRNP)-like protein